MIVPCEHECSLLMYRQVCQNQNVEIPITLVLFGNKRYFILIISHSQLQCSSTIRKARDDCQAHLRELNCDSFHVPGSNTASLSIQLQEENSATVLYKLVSQDLLLAPQHGHSLRTVRFKQEEFASFTPPSPSCKQLTGHRLWKICYCVDRIADQSVGLLSISFSFYHPPHDAGSPTISKYEKIHKHTKTLEMY